MDNKNLKDYIKELGQDIMINLDQNEINEIASAQNDLESKFSTVTSIDTESVEPMYYPIEEIHTFMREDTPSEVNEQKNVLDNAPSTSGDFITIVKVIK